MTVTIIDMTGYRVTGVELSSTHQRYGYVSAFDVAHPLSWAYAPVRLAGSITFSLQHGERQEVMLKIGRAAGARASLLLPLGQQWINGNPRLAEGQTTIEYAWSAGFEWSAGYTWAVEDARAALAALETVGNAAAGTTTLTLAGGRAGRRLPAGQWVGLGDGQCYQIVTASQFDADGRAVVSVYPPLRNFVPAETAVVANATVYGYIIAAAERLVALTPSPVSQYTIEFTEDARPLS